MTAAIGFGTGPRRAAAAAILAAACALPAVFGAPGPAAPKQPPSPPRFDVAMEEARIRMRDGVVLAADLWRPKGARAHERFPVLLEYLPYRKTEARGGSASLYAYFVRRGYVVARVDIRGTGNSEGTLIPYEYSEIEQRDGEDVIAWLARQPFSNGNVGMFGISWGGFNSIHMAMRNPPALKAIIAVDATDDLYQDDVHFMDGMIHVDSWEMSMDLANAMPGAPDYRIDERYFRERFDQPPWMLTYKRQQRDGPFWDRTALKTRYDAIKIPTFVIGGWYDGYRDSVPRMLEHMKAPVKAIVGAWNHTYPDEPYPKPGFEWRREAVRWFDRWLKGRDTGIMEEPRLSVYVREWHPPGPYLEEAPGFWRYEEGWPIARIRERTLYPRPDRSLAEEAPAAAAAQLRYVPTTGIEAGGPVMWFGDVAPDQRPSDAFSLVYETPPLEEDLEILGLPRALLQVSADAPLAHWFARVNDVAPDGTVTLVANAGQNGAHRESARDPKAIEPGKPFPLEIELHFTSWVFPKGHRIRLAVSNAQWPMIWPTPVRDDDDALHGGRRLAPRPSRRAGGRAPVARLRVDRGPRGAASGLRVPRQGHHLRLRRDLVHRPQPADGQGQGRGDEHECRPDAVERGAQNRVDHPRGGGRRPGEDVRAGRVLDRGQARGPDAPVGVRRFVPQRPRELLLLERAEAQEGRRARAREELGTDDPAGFPVRP